MEGYKPQDFSFFHCSEKLVQQRDLSIDILKFIACLAITNSHFDVVYGPLSPIATGGAIGDILFFFASGFTIFLSSRGGATL